MWPSIPACANCGPTEVRTPASDWGKACIANWEANKFLWGNQDVRPGIYPGAWSYIYASRQCIGSEIWSGVDDIMFLPDGKVFSSENGNAYWGLVDGWRRPKPELYLSKFVFSPVWFPVRQLDYQPGQPAVRVPVENRYSFTDLSKLDFVWEVDGRNGKAHLNLAPAARGELEIPIRKGTPQGATLLVRAVQSGNEVVNATFCLGKRNHRPCPNLKRARPSGAMTASSSSSKAKASLWFSTARRAISMPQTPSTRPRLSASPPCTSPGTTSAIWKVIQRKRRNCRTRSSPTPRHASSRA